MKPIQQGWNIDARQTQKFINSIRATLIHSVYKLAPSTRRSSCHATKKVIIFKLVASIISSSKRSRNDLRLHRVYERICAIFKSFNETS